MPIIRENLDRYCWETSILPICRKDLLDEPLLLTLMRWIFLKKIKAVQDGDVVPDVV
jgi:hypothetical protein